MAVADIQELASGLHLIDLRPPMPGFSRFIGTYVIRAEKTALLDVGPACCCGNLLDGLAALGISPAGIDYILVSHIHIDHAGGIGRLHKLMPQAGVIVHERGLPHLANPERLWESSLQTLGDLARQYGPFEPVPERFLSPVSDGGAIDLGGGISLRSLCTPGHAPHHVSYYDEGHKRLFVGEAGGTFCTEMTRLSTPPPYDLPGALASLDRLCDLAPDELCYAHFGRAQGAVSRLKHYREQICRWSRIVAIGTLNRDSLERICETAMGDPEAASLLAALPALERDRERNFLVNSVRGLESYFKRFGIPQAVL